MSMRETARDLETQATRWIVRMDSGLAPDAAAEHEAWVHRSPRHLAAFLRAERAWKQMDRLRRLAPIDRGTADPDLLKKPRQNWLSGWKWAATAVLLVLSGFVAVSIAEHEGGTTYTTSIGEQKVVDLDDGTHVDLNTNTQIRVHFTEGRRSVTLEFGEAVFTVAHDASRPFEVTAGRIITRAVGTRFSVRLHESEVVEAVVTEGRVLVLREPSLLAGALTPKPIGRTLEPGERMLADDRSAKIYRIGLAAAEHRLQWTTGRVTFVGEPLEQVIQELNRYTARPIAIRDSRLRRTPIGGGFDTRNADAYAEDLVKFFGEKRVAAASP